MIPTDEPLISIARLAANTKPRVSGETVRQWMMFGRKCKLTDSLVHLEYTQQGGRIYTSMPAYNRFMLRINGEPVVGVGGGAGHGAGGR